MPWGDDALRSREAIKQLFREGVVYHGEHVLLIARHVPEESRKVLFVASRKVGKAVRRNRAKRLMRAAYQRLTSDSMKAGLHLAWIARSSCAGAGMWEIWTEMQGLLNRAGVRAERAPTPGGGHMSRTPRRETKGRAAPPE
ncbi:MAG: ribonuclease P protein component [Candidatus Eisenbacteria sp.]|nr:ribonuclease P protein component [Candidatus Eisenbacteria bacterium]